MDMVPSRSPHFWVANLENEWTLLAPKYVKYGLYEDNREVGYVVFDGAGSDIKSWFAANRLLDSRWPAMTPAATYNHFSIDGVNITRRFHINRSYGGCPNDIGYLVVIDGDWGCGWDQHETYPQFLYAKDNTATYWEKEHFGRADYIAVSISS